MTYPLPYYEVHGDRGPYLLMVHGLLSSRAQWTPNLAPLLGVCRPVVLELYGHGRSPAPEEPEAFHPDGYVEAFEQIRRRLGASRWLLLGQSLGAGLTLYYALERPDVVMGHLMTNSTSAFADAAWAAALRSRGQELVSRVATQGRAVLERLPAHPKNGRRLPADVRAELLNDAALSDCRGVAMSAAITSVNLALAHRLRHNTVPTLLLCGVRERDFLPRCEHARRVMPQLQVVELDAGHAVNLGAVESFNHHATGFIHTIDSNERAAAS